MRAIVARQPGGPEVLGLGEVPTPEPGPDEVLVAVRAAGVNRADLLQRQGHYPPPPGASDVLGLEVAGTVAAVGAEVDAWRAGDACVALLAGGGYAEYVAVPAGQVLPPPAGVDLVTAAGLVEVAATVHSVLAAARLAPGEVFLVHGGAGGVGSFAVQWAKVLGATVVTTAGSADKLDYCRQVGADHAVSYRGDWAAEVRERVGAVDVVLDPIGARYLADHVRLLAAGGRLAVIGLQGGRTAELDLSALLARRASVLGLTLRSRPVRQKAAICAAVRDEVWPRVADGSVRPAPQTTFPLADAAEAHRHLESGDNLGKVVLTLP